MDEILQETTVTQTNKMTDTLGQYLDYFSAHSGSIIKIILIIFAVVILALIVSAVLSSLKKSRRRAEKRQIKDEFSYEKKIRELEMEIKEAKREKETHQTQILPQASPYNFILPMTNPQPLNQTTEDTLRLKNEIDELKKMILNLDKQSIELERVGEEQKEIDKEKEEFANYKAELQSKEDLYKKELLKYESEIEELKKEAALKESEHNKKIEEISNSFKEKEQEKEKIAATKKELQERVEQLAVLLKEKEAENIEQQKALEDAEKQVESKEEHIKQLSKDNEKLKTKEESAVSNYEELEREKDALQRLAFKDAKIGTLNSNAFNKDFSSCILSENCLALIDTRGMKAINEKEGRGAGDKVLREIAKILIENFSEGCVYRTIGDQFGILSKEGFREIKSKLNAINKSLLAEGIKIAFYCEDGVNFESKKDLLQSVENKLKQIKGRADTAKREEVEQAVKVDMPSERENIILEMQKTQTDEAVNESDLQEDEEEVILSEINSSFENKINEENTETIDGLEEIDEEDIFAQYMESVM